MDSLNICIIGGLPRAINSTGLQALNETMARQLAGMGHQVDVFIPLRRSPNALQALQTLGRIDIPGVKISDVFDLESRKSQSIEPVREAALRFMLEPYDRVIISDVAMDFARLVRAAGKGKAIVWTHGMQCSPFDIWDGAELKTHDAKYVCISRAHYKEAVRLGFREQSVMIHAPAPARPQEVAPASGRGIAIGSLCARKCYGDIARIAAALRKPVDVYGDVQSAEVLALVEASPWLEYRGKLPHNELLEAVRGADFMIHTARHEGFPVAVREAMSLGIPVIAWDISLYRDNGVDPAKNILLPLRGDIKAALAVADWKALRSIKSRRALAAETQKHYGPAAFAEKLAALLVDAAAA